ncbi:sigma 54-interacting transcriptional regulator [Lachnospiraceae bacterium ZAX-1]
MNKPLELDELLKLVIDALYLSIVIDETGTIRYVSQNYTELLKMERKDIIGFPVEQIIPNTRLTHVLKTKQAEIGEIFIMNNGDYTICNRFPLFDKHGQIRGVLSSASFSDLDKIHILNKELIQLRDENTQYKRQLADLKRSTFSLDSIAGSSPQIMNLKDSLKKIANCDLPVLFTGETGTGKEVFANAIHQLSGRRFEKYFKINCAAIPKDLLESELFGYSEGAFSGAVKGGKIGKLEYVNHGTILLDEIGEMPMELQAKLLRVLQENELERIGSTKTVKLDVRVICSTNQNLEAMIRAKTFRQDLYYRINTIELTIPPLRERLDDMKELCEYFIKTINSNHNCTISGISQDVLDKFCSYPWPGNIRELEHVMERACVLTESGTLTEEHFHFFTLRLLQSKPFQADKNPMQMSDLAVKKAAIEKATLLQALEKNGGNKSNVAKYLNISRSQLYEKLKKYNLSIYK